MPARGTGQTQRKLSQENYEKNKTIAQVRKSDPVMYQFITEGLRKELAEIVAQLENNTEELP